MQNAFYANAYLNILAPSSRQMAAIDFPSHGVWSWGFECEEIGTACKLSQRQRHTQLICGKKRNLSLVKKYLHHNFHGNREWMELFSCLVYSTLKCSRAFVGVIAFLNKFGTLMKAKLHFPRTHLEERFNSIQFHNTFFKNILKGCIFHAVLRLRQPWTMFRLLSCFVLNLYATWRKVPYWRFHFQLRSFLLQTQLNVCSTFHIISQKLCNPQNSKIISKSS